MGKFDGVLLAVDFDDTLRPFGMREVPENNIKAINYFTQNGGYFTVATGRDLRSFQSIKHLFPIHIPAVVSNGAAMYDKDTDKIVYEVELPEDCRGDIAELMEKYPQAGVEIHRGFEIFVPQCNDGVIEHLGRIDVRPDITSLDRIHGPWTKFAMITTTAEIEDERSRDMCAYIEKRWPEKYEPVISGGIVDVAPAGVTKGKGIEHLARMLDVKKENIYCAGDSWNDLPMMAVSHAAFAPANANPEIFTPSVNIVCSASQGAVEEIVDILDRWYD